MHDRNQLDKVELKVESLHQTQSLQVGELASKLKQSKSKNKR